MTTAMTVLSDLLPSLHALSPADKVKAIRVLAEDLEAALAANEGADILHWSHFEAGEAAAVLQQMLDEQAKPADSRK